MQLVFIDKTTLDIGPNSSIVIDKFVFDPAAAKGEMAVSLGKGVLRVVGGQATHTVARTVTTPFATIGLRGASSRSANPIRKARKPCWVTA